MGTVTAPISREAKSSIVHSGRFSLRMATRSPLLTPHLSITPDTAMTRSRSVREEIGTHSSPSRCNMTLSCWRSTTARKTSLSVRRLIAKEGEVIYEMNVLARPSIKQTRQRFDRSELHCYDDSAGWSSLVARWAHNPKVGGSNPPPATNLKYLLNPQRSTVIVKSVLPVYCRFGR